ncbi:hypothetical protein GMD78_08415 [Ornithinibacillus sp. L9]|uniref:Uncharacterized protein n=1 Tax=Ornithinibacillus caprae TaxID=2678566 RepID=A0A6N8FFF3_9BACI|nr:hypothetical protein [Ornithinibacillus caprae]MUK88412.1 hypothetical protein [Ornithinibacillus caprae]
MTKERIVHTIFSDANSSLKLSIALFSQLILFLIFWESQQTFNPLGLSLLITTGIIFLYTWLKIQFYENVNKRKATIQVIVYLVIWSISGYIAFFYTF